VIPSLWRATPPVTSEPSLEVVGSSPISRLSLLPALTLNQGPFPPPALPGFHGTTGLSATRYSPACPSRASGWRSRPSAVSGFPCCVKSPYTCMPSPLPRRNRWSASLLPNGPGQAGCQRRRPSPLNRRVGFRVTLFEACSAFTRVTACTLAESPKATLYSEGFNRFVTSSIAPIATGWSDQLPGGNRTH